MPTTPDERGAGESPRTDLPPRREPYDDGYFGTEEEEGVVREVEAGDEADGRPAHRQGAEDAAGGDRGLE